MRWDDVQKFYYSATKRSVNLIPVGTYYSYKLIDGQGKKISLGTGIAQPKALGVKLIELTQAPLLKRAAQQFDGGENVDFGPVKISRVTGLTVTKWFGGWKQVPLNEVQAYAIQNGQFCIWGDGQKLLSAATLPAIPNAFALHALLDIVLKPKGQSAAAAR